MNQGSKTVLIIAGVIVGVLVVLPLLLGQGGGWSGGMMGPGMMGSGMMGGFGGWGWFMPFFGIFFWIFIIWAIVSLFRWGGSEGSYEHHAGGTESALDVLKKRYARGDISREEFEERKRELA